MTTRTEYAFDTAAFMRDIRASQSADASLRDLARELGLSASTFSRIDNGHTPDMRSFLAVCGALGLTPGDYFVKQEWRLVEDTKGKRV